ncbi:hypothetical protein XENOCAPTIV_012302 [Xenoophorus captivus]|uniref:Secreted protein n=1 Tax=Xenoophorus captivus TaxID=1517983 RepID=A0ABV0RCI7_9TELE
MLCKAPHHFLCALASVLLHYVLQYTRGKRKKRGWGWNRERLQLFHSTQLHPLKENDVPLEVGVCLAGREMADLGRVIDWKSGVCHSTLVLRGVIHSRLLREASAAGEK